MSNQGDGDGRTFRRPVGGTQQSRWRFPDSATGAGTTVWSQGRPDMPTEVKLGQSWSVWVPGRRQWLLAKVIRRDAGRATLAYDARYGAGGGHDEQAADEVTMLATPN